MLKRLSSSLRRLALADSDRLTFALLALFLFAGLAGSMWQLALVSEQMSRDLALEHTRHYNEALSAFRTLYTKSVVSKARQSGMEIRHDHAGHANAIPLPATLTKDLGDLMASKDHGVTVRLYSDFPFPWRKEGGPRDAFERRALEVLRASPDTPYYEFETLEGQARLRYATADRMREACVNCHNSHPDTPRNDWKVGDVRGVLATSKPMEAGVGGLAKTA